MTMAKTGVVSKVVILFILSLAIGLGCSGNRGDDGKEGDVGPVGPPGDDAEVTVVVDNAKSVEACIGCHGAGGVKPVFDVTDTSDVHYVDPNPLGPETASGYRQLAVNITEVDVTGTSIIIEFDVEDEGNAPVSDIFAGDLRFNIASLEDGAALSGDSSFFQDLINRVEDPGGTGPGPGTPELQGTSERFGSGVFEAGPGGGLVGGEYRYTSAFNPAAPTGANDIAVVDGETYRLAIQLSAGDLPAGNGWCDFVADTTDPNDDCDSAAITREIVETDTCNRCHGATPEVHLALHGGGRTQVEYCVTCHNPGSTDANTGNTVDFKVMIHKIHAGSSLEDDYMIYGFRNSIHDYSTVSFTAELDNCAFCHNGGGNEVDAWKENPTREACGSCHDDVNFATGENHPPPGGVQLTNAACAGCHPDSGAIVLNAIYPVETVHQGTVRNAEAGLYAGGVNGFDVESLSWDEDAGELTIGYSVTRDDVKMDLANDPEWTAGGGASRLALSIGWHTDDYTNEDSGVTPALPISVNALTGVEVGVTKTFEVVVDDVGGASDSLTVTMDGHPAADLDGDGTFSDRIPVRNSFLDLDINPRGMGTVSRRVVVDVDRCNVCHDSAGVGISLHGNNRTSEPQVCVVCHNPDATDINRRPDPGPGVDGKDEEMIDFKRMIHMIHTGAELDDGLVIYGFGGSVHDFSHVEFIGNRQNCETCHEPGTYSTEAAYDALATTIDTGDDAEDFSDDLNISPTASVCS
ncbi:MAG: OmcA/MtrC family decaheme c-type cytochrome, partial [Deltaproteobacteria bacterium]|nr:OmcA/MtrC family decaheme c-type cytochrome [Deltaproteobacteria bacterium]